MGQKGQSGARGQERAARRAVAAPQIAQINAWADREQRREKGGLVPDSGACPRGINDEDSYGGRYLGAAPALVPGGQRHDRTPARALLTGFTAPYGIADKDDSQALIEYLEEQGATPVIPVQTGIQAPAPRFPDTGSKPAPDTIRGPV